MGLESIGVMLVAVAEWLWRNSVAPIDQGQLTVAYLFWVATFLAINVVWDWNTDKTPPFHISMLKEKVNVAYDAATFCSSVLIIAALVSPSVRALGKDTTIPLVIAAVSGILRALPALCPYKVDQGPTLFEVLTGHATKPKRKKPKPKPRVRRL